MSSGSLSAALALVSSLLFATSASLQQSSARKAALADPDATRFLAVAGIARTLVTSRRWLAGQVASVAGFASHAAALRYGALPMVQALLVVQLLFALPLAARRRGRPLLRRDWAGTVAVCCGLALLIAQGVPHGHVRVAALPEAGGVILAAVALLLIASRTVRSPQMRSALTAMAAGCCVSTTAVVTAIAVPALPHLTWALLGIPVTTTIGAILTQEAFARGSLPTALTTMTITDPTLSYLAGMTLFAVGTRPRPVPLLFAGAIVITGIVLLANSPTLHDERDPDGVEVPVHT
ncbi:DMT family transporter [Nocardia sp. alder85J]|uniref:DMT family transporter n=1 Tax=Nocardia sp. alder85J TaxID=2862949 RepID=UPI001CD5DC98|nr:DMT family transporter [Nocardia sp. alder85J]MCX4098652.1 DMT family transporter [Nocardia sp. alder85J]